MTSKCDIISHRLADACGKFKLLENSSIVLNCSLPAVSYLRNVFVHIVPNDIFENKPFKSI